MSFKDKNIVWTEVGTSKMLPAGAYDAMITDVEDVESKEYLRFTYEIADGKYQGFFADEDRIYTHQFVRSYKDSAIGFMTRFLRCVDASNENFDLDTWDNDPSKLVGLHVGIIVQREDYTNNNGEDRARMNVEGFASVDDVKNGRFTMPEPKDTRKKQSDAPDAQVSAYDADVPF